MGIEQIFVKRSLPTSVEKYKTELQYPKYYYACLHIRLIFILKYLCTNDAPERCTIFYSVVSPTLSLGPFEKCPHAQLRTSANSFQWEVM
jgi:hypothetical protein